MAEECHGLCILYITRVRLVHVHKLKQKLNHSEHRYYETANLPLSFQNLHKGKKKFKKKKIMFTIIEIQFPQTVPRNVT